MFQCRHIIQKLKSIDMKKLTNIIAVLAIFISGSAFAFTADNVTREVKEAFEKKFNGARGVSWKESNDLFFASFELNQRKLTAAYNADGELLGLSRNISISEVPLTVSESLKRNFGDYQILESVTEVLYDGQTSYYINAENATRSLQLKCYADGEIAITKRVKK
jgi:hypothetical protein